MSQAHGPVNVAITVLVLAAAATAIAGLARRYDLSAPLALMGAGVVASFLPFVPEVHLRSDLVLLGFLPPLLYAAAIRTSLVDMKANRSAIGFLSVALVIGNVLAIGLRTWWLLPVPLAAAAGCWWDPGARPEGSPCRGRRRRLSRGPGCGAS